jgi:hypothetical protein
MLTKLASTVLGAWRWLAIIAAVASLAWLHGCQTGAQREKAAQAAQTAKAIEKARRADQSAAQAVSKAKQEVEKSNADAKAAAAGSDDPLKAALDSLR